MSEESKKILATIVYFTLAALAIASAGFFIFALVAKALPMWAEVIYYIWSGLVIGAIVFDIICTMTGEGKYVSGLIIYVLSVLCVAMSIILYITNATRTGLVADFMWLYLTASVISLMTTGYMIATWCVGQSQVQHSSNTQKIAERKNRQQ